MKRTEAASVHVGFERYDGTELTTEQQSVGLVRAAGWAKGACIYEHTRGWDELPLQIRL